MHLAQRTALSSKVLGVYENGAAIYFTIASDNAIGWNILIPHAESGTAVADKTVYLYKSARIQKHIDSLTGGLFSQCVLLSYCLGAAALQNMSCEIIELSKLFRSCHDTHFLSHSSSRTP